MSEYDGDRKIYFVRVESGSHWAEPLIRANNPEHAMALVEAMIERNTQQIKWRRLGVNRGRPRTEQPLVASIQHIEANEAHIQEKDESELVQPREHT